MAETALCTQQLSKVFHVGVKRKSVRALSDLDLRVEVGEIFGFLGPNGAGKSTTIKLMMGLLFPTKGRIEVFGREVPSQQAALQVGFLPENPYFQDFLTPEELLRLAGRLCRVDGATLERRIPELIELVGLAGFAKVPLRKFSKGMVQRAGIAQALINDPKLVVLDEPMSGLDPIGRKDVREIIFRLKEQGKTVFFSTHILPDVEVICDRVGLLLNGRLADSGRLADLLAAKTRAVDVVVDQCSDALFDQVKAKATRVVREAGGVGLTFADESSADEAIGLLARNGTRIVSVARHRESLEDLFMRRAAEVGHRS